MSVGLLGAVSRFLAFGEGELAETVVHDNRPVLETGLAFEWHQPLPPFDYVPDEAMVVSISAGVPTVTTLIGSATICASRTQILRPATAAIIILKD